MFFFSFVTKARFLATQMATMAMMTTMTTTTISFVSHIHDSTAQYEVRTTGILWRMEFHSMRFGRSEQFSFHSLGHILFILSLVFVHFSFDSFFSSPLVRLSVRSHRLNCNFTRENSEKKNYSKKEEKVLGRTYTQAAMGERQTN